MRTIAPLTALRGAVAVWVVAHHCLQHSPPEVAIPDFLRAVLSVGYVGVDIFFVLSGFVLAYVHTDIAWRGLVDFARRRAARIYPLNLVLTGALVLIAAAGWDCGAPVSWPALPLALSMLQPFFLTSPKWLLVNWSVGIELACYAGFPFTMMALRRLSWGILAGALLLAFWTDYQAQRHYSTFWWGWPALARCVPAFILGVVGYMFVAKAPSWIPRISTFWISFLEISFAAAIFGAACMTNTVLIPGFAAALILLLYANRGVLARCLSARPLVWLGDVSFSIYLVHLPIVVLLTSLCWRSICPGRSSILLILRVC